MLGGAHSWFSIPPPILSIMQKLTPAVQRLILAFTTGLFLACAAHVSGDPGGMSSVSSFAAP